MDYRDSRRRRDSRGRYMRDRSDRRMRDRYDHDEGYDRYEIRRYDRRDERMDRRDRMDERMDRRDREDRMDRMDERQDYEYDRRYDDYDSHSDMEYNDMFLTKKEMKEWKRSLENADGSQGAKFGHEQVINVAKDCGIKFHKYTEDEFVMTVNMMYADYCQAIGQPDITVYAKMAKAFLEDPDSKYDGGEKLAIYYDNFVM